MKQLLLAALAAAAGLLAAGPAPAQYYSPNFNRPAYGPGYRPMLSPYLDLTRGGDPAVNYFLGTIPEFQRRSNAAAFSSAILDLEARTTNVGPTLTEEALLLTPLPGTGHPTAFGVTSGYFGAGAPAAPGGGVNRAAPAGSRGPPPRSR
jgi:hypothetical protein